VFFCNNSTQDHCFSQCLVGSLEKYYDRLAPLREGDPVLLYNYESNTLVGYFTAASEAKLDLSQEEWIRRYRAQVRLHADGRIAVQVPREKLESIPGLNFNGQGYLTNISLPIEVVREILDFATGRKTTAGKPASREESDFRKKFPAAFLCSDGHWVRSKAELLIDNWLYTRRPPIAHAYERRLPVPEEAYADFYIPLGDVYIEFWGLDSPEYTERKARKLDLFSRYDFQVISLGEHELEKLDDILPRKLLTMLPSGYRFQ